MRMFVFSMRTFDELPCFEKYCPKYGIEYDYTTETPCMDNLDLAKGYDVVNVITTVFDQPMLKKLHDMGVKCIATRTIGYDHIDVDYAKSLGMGVIHISYSPNSVADYAIMMMLMGLRRMPHIMERANIQDYTLKGKIGRELPDCTVGIIGTGRIGKAVIKNLSGFGCKIIAYDPYPAKDLENVEYVTLDELYAKSDIISLHTFLSDETYHMINKDSIAKMKDGVILINAARGALVDTKNLIEAVESGKIGSVGTDCCEGEDDFIRTDRKYDDLVVNHDYIILKSFQNTIVTPHVAFFTDQAVSDMVESSVKSVVQFAAGEDTPLEVH